MRNTYQLIFNLLNFKMDNIYYVAPSDEIFEEMKRLAIQIWQTYDNTYGYVDEKVGRIKDIGNIKDNFMYIYAMFDYENQWKLRSMASEQLLAEIDKRDETLPF